ncbi:hypothetical protein CC86DRAFT_371664 [Ophiobolus disseminans]|uniref:Uncharacterized protein n=1 Tax=Ophiobolus disseminans TaxID=1469910 RepID=A0A6A6ZU68_9PLEO|nr:hypothetical protein CC86DRAFT_371664 [Ophiobolus disseminans]
MADNQAVSVSLLMGLPLEVRHNIFEYAAARDFKPKKLLRYWFEKQEVKELIAKTVADNPTGPAPQVVRSNEYDEDSDVPEPEEEAEDQDSDDEDGEAQDGEDDEADQDQDQDDDDGAQDNEAETEEPEDDDEDAMDEDQEALAQPSTSVQAQPLPTTSQAAIPAQTADDAQEEASDEPAMDTAEPVSTGGAADAVQAQSGDVAAEDTQDEVDEDGDQAMAGEDDDEDREDQEEDGEVGDNTAQNSIPPQPRVPVVCAARKWRYIPNFMRFTQCPPPAELLLTSKQLNDEAKNWFYDVAVLRISATNSFAHTSFFEEAFSQITDAAFSPMENVRKVEVMFVWDTAWLRADHMGFAQAIFPALLRQRSDFVYKILAQAPDLNEVTIDWHDSAHDDDSSNFMLDILAPFHDLNATVKINEHYIAADAKPHKRSVAGKQRHQFQQIVDAGLDRLF